jgi:glycosyltransferase involved in cell wall biosynthesis
MKILMFGWEFPPHISGGLGTACKGLTQGMLNATNNEILFVIPKSNGEEQQENMQILGANQVELESVHTDYQEFLEEIQVIEVGSNIVPYTQPEQYYKMVSKKTFKHKKLINTSFNGKINFHGGYEGNLFQEIADYAFVASEIANKNSFDVIHAHDWLTFPAGVAAKRVSGKPLVVHVHATDFDRSGGNVNQAVYDMERMGMHMADKIIAVSNLTRNTIINNYGIDAKKVHTVYNAVEPLKEKTQAQRNTHLPDKVVTFLGRLTMQKGPEYFIEAAQKVLQRMENVRFVMAGSGDMYTHLIHKAAAMKMGEKFHFTGFLGNGEVNKMFAHSDVYVMPSVSEPFGISPLEALRSDVPVIISHQSGVAEVLNHALKIDFWDVDAMANAIYAVLNYPGLSKMFKKHGRKEVDDLKWENSALKVQEIYNSVA